MIKVVQFMLFKPDNLIGVLQSCSCSSWMVTQCNLRHAISAACSRQTTFSVVSLQSFLVTPTHHRNIPILKNDVANIKLTCNIEIDLSSVASTLSQSIGPGGTKEKATCRLNSSILVYYSVASAKYETGSSWKCIIVAHFFIRVKYQLHEHAKLLSSSFETHSLSCLKQLENFNNCSFAFLPQGQFSHYKILRQYWSS